MLFRTNEGKLIELKKINFINDKLFYEKLIEVNKPLATKSKPNNIYENIFNKPYNR